MIWAENFRMVDIESRVYKADKFEVLRVISYYIQKQKGLFKLKKSLSIGYSD